MAKPDKAELKKQGLLLKEIIAQGRKKTLNFALVQGKDQMFLVTHLKKNPLMLRKEAKKEGGGSKGVTGTFNVEGKNLIFSVEEEPPGPFPKLTKKHFMTRGIAIRVTFKLPNGLVVDDGEEDEESEFLPTPVTETDEETHSPSNDEELAQVDEIADENPDIPDEGFGASIMEVFGKLRDEASDAIDSVGDDIRREYNELADTFHKSHAGKLFDQAAENLKKLEKFHEKYIKPVSDKLDEYLENRKIKIAAQERMAELDLSETQADQLEQLAVDNPKTFNAAIKALASLDGKFGDLDATPKGITDLHKKVAEAKAKADAADKLHNAAWDASDAARKLYDTAKTTEEEIEEKTKAIEAALVKLRAKLPKDISTLTGPQKEALAKVLNMLKDSRAKLMVATADVATRKTDKEAKHKVYLEKSGIYYNLHEKVDDAKTIVQAAATKKKMLDSMAVGAMSPNSKDPLDEDEVVNMLAAIEANPKFGDVALDLLESSKDKSNIAKGAGMLAKGMANEFKDKDGNPFENEDSQLVYAQGALTMGNALGGDYFDNMNAYIAKGGLNEPASFSSSFNSAKERDQNRAKFVSGAMLGSDGKIDTNSEKAMAAMDEINFHPDVMYSPTPGMNMHFADMKNTMEDPKHKDKIQTALDGITTAPTQKTGRDLVAQSTGKAPVDVTANDTKIAVMSAMFTPLDQGPVGSCFATGPARNLRQRDPAKAMAGMAEIATKGTFTTAQNVPIKAVKTNLGPSEAELKKGKLPPDDNTLMRSWEYTIATAGAQLNESNEEGMQDWQLWSSGAESEAKGNNLHGLKNIPGIGNWENVKDKLMTLIHDGLNFRYNSTSVIEKANDGNSTRGNFEIVNVSKHPPAGPITKKADFITIISNLAIEAAEAKNNPVLSQLIIDHCSSQAFIDAVCLWTKGKNGEKDDIRLPWEKAGGGQEAPMMKVLEGGSPETKDLLNENPKKGKRGHQKIGARTQKVVSALMKNFITQDPDVEMISLATSGIHAFNGLPNHPSLGKLKEGGDAAAAMEKYMLKPGRDMAAKDMDLRKVTMVFDRQITGLGDLTVAGEALRESEKGMELLATAREKRPESEMTPKELKAIIDAVSKPILAFQVKEKADNWKAKQTKKGKAPSDKEMAKKTKDFAKKSKQKKESIFDNNIINSLEPPEFVIADTNYGSGEGHSFFVIIPDPVTGDPKVFRRIEPSGKLIALPDKWLNTEWQVTK